MSQELKDFFSNNAMVIDVRTPEEFHNGHCEGSLNIPLNVLEARMHELDKSKHIILCCASGGRSGMATEFLKTQGFQHVINAGPWQNARRC